MGISRGLEHAAVARRDLQEDDFRDAFALFQIDLESRQSPPDSLPARSSLPSSLSLPLTPNWFYYARTDSAPTGPPR